MVPIYLCDDDPQIRAAIRRELEKEMLIKGYDMKVAAACAGPEELACRPGLCGGISRVELYFLEEGVHPLPREAVLRHHLEHLLIREF